MSYFGSYECMDMHCPGSKSDEQLAAAIAAYLEEHPIDAGLDEAALAAAIAAYLEDHPIDAGLDEAALAAYLVENCYLTDAALADAITQALAEAKASGQFDGEPGMTGADGSPGADGADGVGIESVVQTTTSTEDGGTNVITVTKTDGSTSTFEVRNGSKGNDGAPGADGKDGVDGQNGANGKSAYQYAVDGGYTGTEAEFATKLAAEKFANPNALTFTGAVTGSYDGSEPLTVDVPSGVSSGGGEVEFPNWRLIKTISFSAGIASVDFDTDDDGNTFSLKEIVLAGTVPAYGGYIYMRPASKSNNNAIWPTASKDVRWWAASVNGTLKTMLAVSNASVIWPMDKYPVCMNDTISRLIIGASEGFTADGTMYVYGR